MTVLYIRALHLRDRVLARGRRLLAEERGDALQWVMGLAIAATILIALITVGRTGLDWIKKFMTDAKKPL